MGLINAVTGSLSSVVGDQFKEYVTCPVTDRSVLVARGKVEHGNANTNPTDGVISNGSKIVVPQGFAMMIVDNGAIKEFTAEPGEFIWDSSSEPSVFEGGFIKGIGESIKKIGERITYGGQAARDQRVYYVNLLDITDNKFGSPNTETVFDPMYGSVEITYNGTFIFRVVDPAALVAKLIGANAQDVIYVSDIFKESFKGTFVTKVSECISKVMVEGNVSFNAIQTKKSEICNVMNQLLHDTWREDYGLEIADMTLNINASEESKAIIREVDADVSRQARMTNLAAQNTAAFTAAGTIDAMKTAAGNENGAMMGFMGMGMGQNMGGNMMGAAMGMQPGQQVMNTVPQQQPMDLAASMGLNQAPAQANVQTEAPVQTAAPVEGAKFCTNCGAPVTGKFCSQCGTPAE